MKHKKIALIIILSLFAAIVLLSSYSILTVRNVSFEYACATEKTEAEMLEAGDKLQRYTGRNAIFLNRKKIRSELEANAYFTDVKVDVKFPSTLRVSVSERAEAYAVRHGDEFYIVAEDGVVLGLTADNAARADGRAFPVIEGYDGALKINRKAETEDELFAVAIAIVNAFDDVRNEIRSVVVSRYNDRGQRWDRVLVHTVEGAVYTITAAGEYSDEKVRLLKRIFEEAEGESRTNGAFDIFTAENGSVAYE